MQKLNYFVTYEKITTHDCILYQDFVFDWRKLKGLFEDALSINLIWGGWGYFDSAEKQHSQGDRDALGKSEFEPNETIEKVSSAG